MRDLLESQRRTDGIFRIAGAVAIDESRLVLYAGGMRSQFAPAWYTQSSHNIRTEGIMRTLCIRSCAKLFAPRLFTTLKGGCNMKDATKNLKWFGTVASVPPLRKEIE